MIEIPKARAYLFDMDGVLVDNARFHVMAWLALAEKYHGALTERQVIDWMGAPGRDYVRRMFARPDMPEDEVMRYLHEKEALYRELFRPHLKAPVGLRALLDSAHARGVVCAIATGGSRANVDYVLGGLGIAGDFAAVVDASMYARGKPNSDCYVQAASVLGVPADEAIVFEDAVNGIEAAHAAGMKVIAIVGTNPRTVLESAGADIVIDSFVELAAGPVGGERK